MNKLVMLAAAVLLSASSVFASEVSQCSNECKVGLIDAEFEFAYHSGASSTQIAQDVFNACGHNEKVNTECAKKIRPDEGSIVYLYYAACVHEMVKKDCEDRYDANRPF